MTLNPRNVKCKWVNVRLQENLYEIVIELSEKSGLKISDIVRLAIVNLIDAVQKPKTIESKGIFTNETQLERLRLGNISKIR